MTAQTAGVLSALSRVAFVHAHPDDETIATGALIADLTARGVEVRVLTTTRGERGEIVPGTFDEQHSAEALNDERVRELTRALAALGVERAEFLGTDSARANGREPRCYSDSGMRWVTPAMAGPAHDSPEHAFSLSAIDETTDDVAAWLAGVEPQLVITYDVLGGYGHPDHVRAREVTELACKRLGLPLAELFQPDHETRFGQLATTSTGTAIEWIELGHRRDQLVRALREHRTQLSVDGDEIVHVGGQREHLTTRVGLRVVG